jgi:hypothetical protein
MKRKQSKKAQNQKSKISSAIQNKSGQEEMVGFALIIIIVAVILLVFLGFSLRSSQKDTVESYEVNSFIQAFLQYTADCRDKSDLEYLSIQKLIFDCYDNEMCLDERRTCDVLNSTLKDIVKESWKVEGDRPVKGYELKIIVDEEEMLVIKEGNVTKNYKGSMQDFLRGGNDYEIFFTAYY